MLLRFAFSTQQGTETLRWHVERTFRSYGAHLAYAVLHVSKPEAVTLNFLLLEIKQFGLCRLGWSAELVWSYRRVSYFVLSLQLLLNQSLQGSLLVV